MISFRHPSAGRLILYAASGGSLERRIEARLLERLRDRARDRGGAAARLAWERVGVLATIHLLPLWPSELPPPRHVFLRSPRRFLGALSLQLELAVGAEEQLREYAERLCSQLAGRPAAPPELEAEGLPEVVVPRTDPLAGLPRSPSQVAERPLRTEDLPWIFPGDCLVSARFGRCRVKRVEGDGRAFQLRLGDGSLRLLGAEEILADFQRAEGLDREPSSQAETGRR